MTARQVIDKIKKGETIKIKTEYVSIFMDECIKHKIYCDINIKIEGEVTILS